MHDIGPTQLEHQSFGFEGEQPEGEQFAGSGGQEFGELEGEFGEYREPVSSVGSAELESPLAEMEEMELAAGLLEVGNQQELEQFLGDVFRAVGQATGNFVRSGTGRALGNLLKDSLRSATKQALPVVGRALGDAAGGFGDLGARAGSSAGSLLGLELEGLSTEDREFEVARQLVRFAGSAVGQAGTAPPHAAPAAVARTAATRAAQLYAPGLLPRLQGRSTQPWPRGGRWIRRGRTIVLYGF